SRRDRGALMPRAGRSGILLPTRVDLDCSPTRPDFPSRLPGAALVAAGVVPCCHRDCDAALLVGSGLCFLGVLVCGLALVTWASHRPGYTLLLLLPAGWEVAVTHPSRT